MKKFILPCALALLAVSASAEEMRLVTLLSQPVGSFARVELLDSSKPAKIYNLNFCNTGSSGGTITVTGTAATYPVNATYFVSESGSTLSSREEQGSPVKTYKVVSGGSSLSSDGDTWNPGTMYLVGGADLLGGTLKATNVEFANDTSYRRGLLVAEEDHGDTEFVLPGTAVASVGSFYRMNINSGAVAVFDTPASGSTRCDGLGWDKVASVVESDDTYKDSDTNAKVLLGCTKDLTPEPDPEEPDPDDDKDSSTTPSWNCYVSNSYIGSGINCSDGTFGTLPSGSCTKGSTRTVKTNEGTYVTDDDCIIDINECTCE